METKLLAVETVNQKMMLKKVTNIQNTHSQKKQKMLRKPNLLFSFKEIQMVLLLLDHQDHHNKDGTLKKMLSRKSHMVKEMIPHAVEIANHKMMLRTDTHIQNTHSQKQQKNLS